MNRQDGSLAGRWLRRVALGSLLLLFAPAASALPLRYTFEVEMAFTSDFFPLPGPGLQFTIILDVDDTDLDPNPEAGRFEATRLEIEWDAVSPVGVLPLRVSLLSENEPVFEVRVGSDSPLAGDLRGSFVVERVNSQVPFFGRAVALRVPFNEWLALRDGPITDDALPRSLDVGDFAENSDVSLRFTPGGVLGGFPTSVSVAVVPEPATAILLAAALVGTLSVGRFCAKRAAKPPMDGLHTPR